MNDTVPQTASETSAHFTWTDANGNVCDLIDGSGASAAHYEYTPFGSVAASQGALADANPWQFSSKYYDAETQLKYYGYRYLANGRWPSRDPIEERGGLNLYLGVGNEPVSSFDYLGLDNPGCDLPASAKLRTDTSACHLRCCAAHDKCYADNNCTQKSWCGTALGVPLALLSACVRCNVAVSACLTACSSGGNPNKDDDLYYCPNGPNKGKTYDKYSDIPASCWESGTKPPQPAPPRPKPKNPPVTPGAPQP